MKKSIGVFLIATAGSQMSAAVCDITLNPGANVGAAIAGALDGSTVCLNAGSYSSASLVGINKSSPVTLQSTLGRTAVLALSIQNSRNLKLQNLTINGLNMNSGGNQNISILNNTFKAQAMVVGSGRNATPANILIDGNTFDGVSVGPNDREGRLQLYDAAGVVVSNNHFGGGGDSDGIQWGGYGGQVGPGNVFDGIIRVGERHVDAIQLYGEVDSHTILGNYFINGGSYIMAPDGSLRVTVQDNVFVVGDYWPAIQFGANDYLTFVHNTGVGLGFNIGGKYVTVKDNLLAGDGGINPSCTFNCNFTRNQFANSARAMGTDAIIGAPSFLGGLRPTSWAGYQLSSSSSGYQQGTDGKDMGSNFFGSGFLPSPTPGPTPGPTPTPTPTPGPTPTPTPTPTPSPSPSPSPTGSWQFCANEGGTCTVPGVKTVRYGASGKYITKSVSSGIACTNVAFGSDPIYGVVKKCEYWLAATGQSLFTTQMPETLNNNDGVAYELGMRFKANVSGRITAIRFYKSPSESGTHIGKIYSASGALLASVTFSSESASGWQQAQLSTPVNIAANAEYVVSVNTGSKFYVATVRGMATPIRSGNLNSVVGGSGVFGPLGSKPSSSWNESNYFRDVVFTPN